MQQQDEHRLHHGELAEASATASRDGHSHSSRILGQVLIGAHQPLQDGKRRQGPRVRAEAEAGEAGRHQGGPGGTQDSKQAAQAAALAAQK